MTQVNPTIFQAAGALASTFPKPILEPYINAGTKFRFDFTQGYDCVDALTVGTIPNGSTIHNMVSGAPSATTIASGNVQVLNVGKLGITNSGTAAFTGGIQLGSPGTGYDLSAHPANDFLLTMTGNWTTVGPYGMFCNGPATPNWAACQYGLAMGANAGYTMQACVTGLKSDGVTSIVNQVSFDSLANGYISGTTMTVTSVSNGTLRPGAGTYGQLLSATGMTAGTHVMAQLSSTEPDGSLGKRGTYTVDTSQTLFSSGSPGAITGRSVILGATTHYAMHWGPQLMETYINGVLQSYAAGVNIPNSLSPANSAVTMFYDTEIGTLFRLGLDDLVAGGWGASGAAALAAADYAFYRQRMTDLGIA